MKCDSQEFFERKKIANMLFVSKNISLEKGTFMNSSCFVICELNWIVFMAIVKHFRVKMRLASFCSVNLIKYSLFSNSP